MEINTLIIYLLTINLLSFFIIALDKLFAIKSLWRISEKALFLLAFFGGALFMIFSMYIFRHKTLKKRFVIGLPIIVILQIFAIYFSSLYGCLY